MPLTENEAAEIVHAALTQAADGDTDGGVELLMPLLTSGPGTQYALACMLAEIASYIARRDGVPGCFGISVTNDVTGVSGPVDDMSPENAFAYRFTNAWANRDHGSAEAHFTVLYRRSTGAGTQLLDGLLAVFHMAVVTYAEMLAEVRAPHITGKDPVL